MDVVELGITVDANPGIRSVRDFNESLRSLGATSEQAEKRMSALNAEYQSPAFKDALKNTLAAKGGQEQLNSEISSSIQYLQRLASVTDKHDIDALRGLRELIEQQRAYISAVGGTQEQFLKLASVEKTVESAAAKVTALNREMGEHGKVAHSAGEGLNRFRGVLTSMASESTGASREVTHLSSLLGELAIGGPIVVGILAGITAITLIYDKFTEGTRKAREEHDRFIKSLRDRAQGEEDATVRGSEKRAKEARDIEAQSKAAQRRFNETGGGPSWQADLVSQRVTDATRDRILAEANAAKVLAAAEDKIRDDAMAGDKAIADARFAAADQLKRIDRERHDAAKKADEEALTRLKGLIRTANAALDALVFNPGAGVSFAIEQRLQNDPLLGKPLNVPALEPPNPAQTHQQREQVIQYQALLDGKLKPATEHFVAHANRMADTMRFAAVSIGNTAAQFAIGKFGGNTIGGSVGGGIGEAAASKLGGFGGSVFGQAIFAPLFAGFGAAIGKGIDSIFDFSGAAARAREELEKLRESVQRSVDVERAKLSGGNVGLIQAEADVKAFYADLRARQEAANPVRAFSAGGTDADRAWNKARDEEIAARKRALDEVDALQRDAIAKADKYVVESQKVQREDLEVRAFRAQGRTTEAEALALQLRQRQEILDAEKAGMDAAYIARLKEVQAIEKTTAAMEKLATTSLNVPPGFKVDALYFKYASAVQPTLPGPYNPLPTPYTPQGGPTTPHPVTYRPQARPSSASSDTIHVTLDAPLQVLMPDGTVLASTVVRNLKGKAQKQFGDSSKWSQTQ